MEKYTENYCKKCNAIYRGIGFDKCPECESKWEVGWKDRETKEKEPMEWRDEYCKQFGLCKDGGKCQCKKELKFIANQIKQAEERERERIVKEIEKKRFKIGHILTCKMCSPKCGYNKALQDIINLISSENKY
jgi:hypothetical protein